MKEERSLMMRKERREGARMRNTERRRRHLVGGSGNRVVTREGKAVVLGGSLKAPGPTTEMTGLQGLPMVEIGIPMTVQGIPMAEIGIPMAIQVLLNTATPGLTTVATG